MKFGEKIRELRKEKGISQEELASKVGISYRAFQNYEAGRAYPRNMTVYAKIASELGTTTDFLLSDEGRFALEPDEKKSAGAALQADRVLEQMESLFSSESVTEGDRDKILRAVMDLYWKAKERDRRLHSTERTEKERTGEK